MLDADRRFEERLRAALREEAEGVPFTLTWERLERRRVDRQSRSRRSLRLWLAAAALVLLALGGAAGIAALLRERPPEPAPRPTLPSMTDLVVTVPEASTVLEGRREADDPTASPAPDDRYAVGTITPAFPFVVIVACVGGERMTTEIGTAEGVGTYLSSPAPCDGDIHTAPMAGQMTGEALDVTVTAPAGVSWILAVREYPESYADPPDLPTIDITTGWERLLGDPDDAPVMATAAGGTGIGVTVPPTASRVAAWFTCAGETPAIATFGGQTVTLDCPSVVTERIEAAADPSRRMDARVKTDGLVWVRTVIEVDAGLEIVYPAAPPLPDGLAAVTWAETGTEYLTLGSLGGNAPRLLAMPSHRAGVARDDVVIVAVAPGDGSGRIDQVSVASGSVVRTVLDSPRFVQETWYAATHEVIVYVVGTGSAIEFRAVDLDGSDDRSLLSIPVDDAADPLWSLAPGLAYDDSVFVVDACRGAGCERTIVDIATGESRTVETTKAPVCGMIGVIDGLVIGRHRADCARDDDAPISVVVSPLDGGPSRTLDGVGDADGIVVPTSTGPVVVLTSPPDGLDEAQRIVAVDVTTGSIDTIHEVAAPAFMLPMPIRLPEGFVLLASSLNDDPASRGFIVRPVPILIDLATGARYELANLPHTITPAP